MRGFDDHLDNYGDPGGDWEDSNPMPLFQVLVDQMPWVDTEGNSEFSEREAEGLREHLEYTGETTVEVRRV